jgi:AbrB family looped-hinge helix DNA binding protein
MLWRAKRPKAKRLVLKILRQSSLAVTLKGFDFLPDSYYVLQKSQTKEEYWMDKVKVLAKGQIVIPASIRKKYGIRPGSEIQFFEYGNTIHLVPPTKDPVGEAMGCLPPSPSLAEELLKERQKDFAQ